MSKKILIVVAHDDDFTLSFGGLAAKAIREGDSIKVHVFCMGGPCSNVNTAVRIDEFIDVMNYYKITDYSYDTELDGILNTIPNSKITQNIDKMISTYQPDEVYCSAYSEHTDHIALAKAFTASARLKTGFMPKLFAFGTYPFSDQLYASPNGGKILQPLSDENFNTKCEAFKLHKSQLKPSPSPLGIEGVRVMSEYYGMMCGSKYAELYYQLRYIRSY